MPATYSLISKVVVRLRGDVHVDAWRSYRQHSLFTHGGDSFLCNLYPLGKPNEAAWPVEYERWFGLSRAGYYRLFSSGSSKRLARLRELRGHYNEPLTICFGKRHWPTFAACFADPGDQRLALRPFQVIPSRNLIMTEFFRSTRMPDKAILQLAETLNALNMNPFRL